MPGAKLNQQILIAILFAAVIGLVTDEGTMLAGVPVHVVFEFVGTLFVSALKMLIVPLVTASVIVGMAGIGSTLKIGRLSLRAVTFFLLTSILAVGLGMALSDVARPGAVGAGIDVTRLADGGASADLAEELADKGFGDMIDFFLSIIPGNVFGAAAGDDILGIMFFAALFGHFMARLEHGYADPSYRFWSGVSQIMMRMTDWMLRFAPVGIFCLIAGVVVRTQFDLIAPLVAFAAVVVAALAGHALVTLPLLLRLFGRGSVLVHYKAVAPAFLTAVATGSTIAALPVTLACMQQRAGLSNRVSSFVLPVAAVVNMNGTALYHAVAAVFLAQVYGLQLDIATHLTILALALVTSIGMPGLPSASLVAIAVITSTIGLPSEATGLLLASDRVLEMARAGVNVLGDTVCATMVARLEGEKDGVLAAGAARQG